MTAPDDAVTAERERTVKNEVIGGRFVRQANAFAERLHDLGGTIEPGRLHLYACYACPWAHRVLIVRALKGLDDTISVGFVDPIRDERGWQFTGGSVAPAVGPQEGEFPDTVNGFSYLSEAYLATDPGYDRRVTVPCVWDRQAGRLVTNDFPQIPRDLATGFDGVAEDPDLVLYPEEERAEMDALDAMIYDEVNNGVYKAGFATTQEAYEDAVEALFARLDVLDARLADRRFLMGPDVRLIDIHLYVTLIRFDAVYVSHFKCSRKRIADHDHLSGYLRDLYSIPAFRDTTNMDQIRRHYFGTHGGLNPTRIVPVMPELDLDAPHDRALLGSG